MILNHEVINKIHSVNGKFIIQATAAEQLKDDDWVDPSDPTFIAENELLGAAKSIENAAKKLAALKPRTEIKGKVGRLEFECPSAKISNLLLRYESKISKTLNVSQVLWSVIRQSEFYCYNS